MGLQCLRVGNYFPLRNEETNTKKCCVLRCFTVLTLYVGVSTLHNCIFKVYPLSDTEIHGIKIPIHDIKIAQSWAGGR